MTPVLLALAVTVAAPAPKEAKKDPPSVLGEWLIESTTLNGAPLPGGPVVTVVYTADGKSETRREGGAIVQSGTYTLDPKKEPAEVDLTSAPPAAGTWKGIYRLDGDTLTVCVTTSSSARPTSFEGKAGSGYIVTVYRRVPKKKE